MVSLRFRIYLRPITGVKLSLVEIERSNFNLLVLRLEKAEKVEKEESSEAENQRRLPNQDQLELDYR
jgi:hypothetical protein